MKSVAPKISDQAAEFYPATFRNLNQGVTFTLEMFPSIYRLTLNRLKGQFVRGELMLMIDVFNGTMLTPQITGQHLLIQCSDGMELDNLDEKWEINKRAFLEKLKSLTLFEAGCLEIWANGFWHRNDGQEDLNIEAWASQLLG